jgi:hypothetical protein
MTGVLTAWLAEMAIITYRGAKLKRYDANPIAHLPLPSEYAASAVIFGTLGVFGGRAQAPAQLFAWGIVAATLLNLWTPAGQVRKATGTVTTTKPTTGAPTP